MNSKDWFQHVRSVAAVRRLFPGGSPQLRGLRLIRTVIGLEFISLVVGYEGIPDGATEKWRQSGYKAVDLVLRFSGVRIEQFDAAGLLQNHRNISALIEAGSFRLQTEAGLTLFQLSFQSLDAEFVPDPFMQRFLARKDQSGTELEPGAM